MTAARAFDRATATGIARAFLPGHWYGNRWHYHYSRAKLASDPLYPGVIDALRGSQAPLLDLGCGIGLLAHALRAAGIGLPYHGIDNDAAKIAQAQQAAGRAGLHAVEFSVVDLAAGLPAHRGSVALLDVLQFVPAQAQQPIIAAAIAMLIPGSKLVIRTGLDDGSRRARITRAVDALSRLLGWMNSGPKRYPNAAVLRTQFDAAGLQSQFTALYGNTPFNNWLVVATHPA
ncbi:MAG: class I SAM-dependent methyltransferase [Gammaproteobacteria bacterium]|nr:class I SAM-dependent methyltransferase [Gammaproteobacteria bacterium]